MESKTMGMLDIDPFRGLAPDRLPDPRGRAPRIVAVEVVRELTLADLALLQQPRGSVAPPLKALRDAHHAIARLIAQGQTNAQIGAATGYSQSRISILKADPTFAELVAHYREHVELLRDEAYADGIAKLIAVRDEGIEILHDMLLENTGLTPEFVLEVTKMAADRTGIGPSSKSTSVNVNIDYAEQVARGRARAERSWAEQAIPIEHSSSGGSSRYTYTENDPSHRIEGSKSESE